MSSKTKKFLMLLLLANLLALSAYFFFFFTVKTKNEEASRIGNLMAFEMRKQETVDSMKVLLADTELERGKLDSFLVQKEKVVAFLEMIESLGKSAEVTARIDAVGERQGEDKTSHLNLTVSFSGSWVGAMRFLSFLEALPYHVKLTAFEIRKTNDGTPATKTQKQVPPQWAGSVHVSITEDTPL